MHVRIRRTTAAVVGTVVAIALTGCAPSRYPVFDEQQTADDRLPWEIVESIDLTDFDLSTSRFSATHDGVDYYLVKPRDGGLGPCLALLDESGPRITCAADGLTIGSDPEVQVVPQPPMERDGWVAISENLRVREHH